MRRDKQTASQKEAMGGDKGAANSFSFLDLRNLEGSENGATCATDPHASRHLPYAI